MPDWDQMAVVAVASSAGDVAGKLASWDLICSGNLRKKSPSSNLEVSLVAVSGHKDKMLSMRTDGFSAPRGGEVQKVIDLLHLSFAVRPTQPPFQLCVGVGVGGVVVDHFLHCGHFLCGQLAHAVVVLSFISFSNYLFQFIHFKNTLYIRLAALLLLEDKTQKKETDDTAFLI